MNRRTFSKISSITLIGSAISLPTKAVVHDSLDKLRLGGPLFGKFNSPEEWISELNKNRYRAAYCPVGPNATEIEIRAYEMEAKKADIIIAEVGAWSNPISPKSDVAKEALEKCIHSLQLADAIGASCCVNIAGSKNRENWSGPHPENFSQDTFDLVVETTRKIIDEVKPSRTFFTLEAMPWIFPESPDSYLKLIKAIDRKAFAVHLDPVNMMVSPAVFFRNGDLIQECFKKLGPYIKSCHAKDLVLKEGTFMPQFDEVIPGKGNMDYRIFLKELSKYPEVPLMMEHLNSEQAYKEGADYIRGIKEEI